jgi:twitching motility protein PilT
MIGPTRRFSAVTAKTVLVVHDDADLVASIRAALSASASDIELINALSGPRALGMMAQAAPSVLVVDAELAGVDGYSFTRQVKTAPATAQVPVIIVSLDPNEVSALKARQVGAAAHLPSTGPVGPLVAKITALAAAAQPAAPADEPAPVAATSDTAVDAPVAGIAAPASVAPPADAVPVAAQAADVSAYGAPQPVSAEMSYATNPGPAPQPSSAKPQVTAESRPSGPAGSSAPHIDDMLRMMLERGGSDLHIAVGSAPGIRQRGELIPVENMRPLSPRDTMEMILGLLSEEQRRRFETELELDFAYSIPGVSRFRANVFQQRNSMGAVFRVIPIQIPTLEDLGLPKVCTYLAERPRGLVLVTGPTGSGKSTTLAAMVDHINETRALHIMTMEDPIEFMHRNKKSYVNQREVGEDTHSFAAALKRVLRQDPDVIMVGEMRDLETISSAITAAETGHLVLATLHTTGGPETVDRVIDVFPPHQQQQVRMQLSNSLEGVLSQTLLRSTDGRGRLMAMEIMLGVPAIQNLIREGKTHQMETIIQGGASLGMQTLDQGLKNLLTAGKVTFEEAISKAKSPRDLAAMVGRKL